MTRYFIPKTALLAVGLGFINGPAFGETLFEKLDAASTGIDHRHSWVEKNRDNANSLNSYASTVGVTLGDYDGDGLLDVFMGDQKDGGNLYRNLGGFKFENVTAKAGLKLDGVWTTGVTFADVNGDGLDDLFIGAFRESNRLYLSNGDGTFKDVSAASGLGLNLATTQAAFADFDRDGDLDCYLQTNKISAPDDMKPADAKLENGKVILPEEARQFKEVLYDKDGGYHIVDSGQQDLLLENDGTGVFTDVTKKLGIESAFAPGLSAVWWDVNNDMWPDLYVANDFYLYDELWINEGGKKFRQAHKETFPHQPWFSMGSDFADLNGDGFFDYLATDMSPSSHFRSKLTMGDMSADTWFLDGADPPQVMRNAVYLNQGQGHFTEVAQQLGLDSTGWTWAVRAADLDLDGRQDLFYSTGMTRDYENSDLNNELRAILAKIPREQRAKRSQVGKAFWREKPQLKLPNLAFRNAGEMKFDDVSAAWGIDEVGVSTGVAIGDLDDDGDPDLIVMNFDTEPSVYRNTSQSQRLKIKLVGEESHRSGVGARVIVRRADGSEDHRMVSLMRGYHSSSGTEEIFGFGESTEPVSVRVMWPSGKESLLSEVKVGATVVISEKDTEGRSKHPPVPKKRPLFGRTKMFEPVKHTENRFDEFAREPLLPQRVSTLGPGLAVTDINGDGFTDVLLTGAKGASSVLACTRRGSLASIKSTQDALNALVEHEHVAPLFFDADGDGDQDLILTSGGTEVDEGSPLLKESLFINEGRGRLVPAPEGALPDLRFSAGAVVAADFDKDGDLDLFIAGRAVPGAYPTGPRSALLRNDSSGGQAKFTDITKEACPELLDAGMITSALWSDVNGDRAVDLLVTREWGPVSVYWNRGDGTFMDVTEPAGLSEITGWFNSISSGDIDHDGDMDYVVGNFGRNTKYHPTKKKPAKIFYGDFDESGKGQIVEAKTGSDGELIPVRGKSCSQNAMPFIRKKLPTYEKFAKQDLLGIYEKEKLEKALEMQANTLDSAILRNNGEGKLIFEPLPAAAQVAPVFGTAMVDVNGDRHLDLLLAQNFYGPQRETGRFNGGVSLVMLGDGEGNFEPLAAHESGVSVPGDATALAVTDLNFDERPDFLIATNNGPTQAFVNLGQEPYKRIKIEGHPANRYAAGGRMTVEYADGLKSMIDLSAGSGYLSQSSPYPMFAMPEGKEIKQIVVNWPSGSGLVLSVGDPKRDLRVKWTMPPGHDPTKEGK